MKLGIKEWGMCVWRKLYEVSHWNHNQIKNSDSYFLKVCKYMKIGYHINYTFKISKLIKKNTDK